MAGAVRKRGEKWYYSYEVGQVRGKRKRIERVGGKTKKEAEASLRKALEALESGGVINDSNISFSDFLDLYFTDYVLIHCKYNTQLSFKNTINNFKKHLGKYKLINVTPAMCQNFINELARQKKHLVQ